MQLPKVTGKVVEITRDENGNLKEIYRPDVTTELRYPLREGDSTSDSRLCNRPELCFAFEYPERLDFYVK